jgi:uncharacterized protein (TIRG00374 family)
MAHPKTAPRHAFSGRYLLITALIFIGIASVFGLQTKSLSASIVAVRQADPALIAIAIVLFVVSYIAAALSYVSLTRRRLHFAPTFAVQTASGLANRILPAGLGSIGLFAAYLHKQGYGAAGASAIVAANNLMGIIGNLLLIGIVFLLFPDYVGNVHVPHITGLVLYSCLAVVVFVVVVYFVVKHTTPTGSASITRRILRFLHNTADILRGTLRPNWATAGGLVSNVLLTCLMAAVLSLAVAAVGGTIAWPAALLVLSLGTFIGSAIPTPGGVGGVEAGMLAGLLAFGVVSSYALAGVLLYRLLTYWLPIIPGLLISRFVGKHYV